MVKRASDGDNNAESERSKLKAAFEKVADANGFLVKAQLQVLSEELGMQVALTASEIDKMWMQMQQHVKNASRQDDAQISSEISFETFWRWWVSNAVYDHMSHQL